MEIMQFLQFIYSSVESSKKNKRQRVIKQENCNFNMLACTNLIIFYDIFLLFLFAVSE